MEGETESGREGWREREGQSHQSAMPSFVHWFHWERIKNETVRECPWLCPFNYRVPQQMAGEDRRAVYRESFGDIQ